MLDRRGLILRAVREAQRCRADLFTRRSHVLRALLYEVDCAAGPPTTALRAAASTPTSSFPGIFSFWVKSPPDTTFAKATPLASGRLIDRERRTPWSRARMTPAYLPATDVTSIRRPVVRLSRAARSTSCILVSTRLRRSPLEGANVSVFCAI